MGKAMVIQTPYATLPNGLRLVECIFAKSLVPTRKCRNNEHEVCARFRKLVLDRIQFRQNQFRPARKTKVTRRRPRVRDYGPGGRPIGEGRKPRKRRATTTVDVTAKLIRSTRAILKAVKDDGGLESVAIPDGRHTARELRKTALELKLDLPNNGTAMR